MASHRSLEGEQNYIPPRGKGAKKGADFLCVFAGEIFNVYNGSAREMGATGFDRNLNDRRDACRARLMQLVKKRREKQLPITMNWLSLPN